MTVVCLVEHDGGEPLESSLRAVTLARSVGSPVVALAVGESAPSGLAEYGVEAVHVASSERLLAAYAPVAWARSLLQLAESVDAGVIVAAGTDRGHEVLAHAAALADAPMAANCVSAAVSEEALTVTRYRWAGSLLEDAVVAGRPALLSVVPDAAPITPADAPGAATVVTFEPTLSDVDFAVAVARLEPRAAGSVSLGDARVVVGGGRGVGSAEAFEQLSELAGLLGGTVGVSRVVTSLGWRPHSEQVGQTGTKIAPDLYLACGISGAIQHLAGCQGAKHVIAINTDGEAPIMKRADYAVIGDVGKVVPALIDALKSR